ncbi:MAG: BREX-3 system P-loop-containing protein BrxF [Butyrivibrio sp.]|nr:BREX-3 system P-loop-containing protein BrxF [Muribaculum sp.]MCM1551090.1 BREX-3 system P-loop-containing protein BrxF [Butyrivibrio sp.]
MGKVINRVSFATAQRSGLLKPVIYCVDFANLEGEIKSINIELAKELETLRPKRRTMQLEARFNRVLDRLPDNVVIRDFDVMFNPAYKVDVLKILVASCKRKPFNVIWPGRYEDGKLFYAEEGYPDYKVFDINNYDVTCVI